jgi:hypothetical protein
MQWHRMLCAPRSSRSDEMAAEMHELSRRHELTGLNHRPPGGLTAGSCFHRLGELVPCCALMFSPCTLLHTGGL